MANAVRRMRNDSMLSTGMTSAADRKRLLKQEELHNKRAAEKEAKQAALGSLSSRGAAIAEWIAEERKELDSLTGLLVVTDLEAIAKHYPVIKTLNIDNKDLMSAQMIARLMHLDYLAKLEKKVKKTMREPLAKKAETVS